MMLRFCAARLITLWTFILIFKYACCDAGVHDLQDSTSATNDSSHANQSGAGHGAKEHHGIHVASWQYDYVSAPFLFTSFVVAIVVLKILYHHIKPLAASFPESCLLIILGILLGLLFLVEDAKSTLSFLTYDKRSFFLFLLPPIILEAAYSLRDRAFVENIGTILLYAVVIADHIIKCKMEWGTQKYEINCCSTAARRTMILSGTILNVSIVGPMLYGAWYLGAMEGWLNINFLDCLIFSALIAAVDPVAVLAIFQEVGVNKMLYFMVFGESLFNDAVTVVIYTMFVDFTKMDHVGVGDIFLGIAAFLCVSFGGIVIGLVFGLLTGLITKFTSHIRIVEPVVFFALAYLSYLCAEMVHFSGIISIICCGLMQGYYAMENISSKSYISIVYFSKVTSSVMEALIFIILGVMMVNDTDAWKEWSTGFSFWSLIFCLFTRFAVVFFITYFINTFLKGIRTVSYQEQFIMAYGGLRGAISFSLAFMLDSEKSVHKNTILTTTYFIILVTVFIQGISIKPLVKAMRIKLDIQDSNIFNELNRAMFENTLAGVEEIIGHRGTHYWTAVSKYLSQRFVRPAIQKNPHKKSCNLLLIYQETAIQQQLRRNISQSDVPKQAALWSQLNAMDNTSMSGSASEAILQAQDDYAQEEFRKESQVRKESAAQMKKSTKKRPGPLKLDSPKELLQLRDMLSSPANKTMHYVYDKDLKSPSRQKFAEQMAHMAANKWRTISKRVHHSTSAKRLNKLPPKHTSDHLLVPGTVEGVGVGLGKNSAPTIHTIKEEEQETLLSNVDKNDEQQKTDEIRVDNEKRPLTKFTLEDE